MKAAAGIYPYIAPWKAPTKCEGGLGHPGPSSVRPLPRVYPLVFLKFEVAVFGIFRAFSTQAKRSVNGRALSDTAHALTTGYIGEGRVRCAATHLN